MPARRNNNKYTKYNLQKAVDQSESMGDVLRYFNRATSGGVRQLLSKKIKEYGIDTSHFTSKSTRRNNYVKDYRVNSKTRTNKPKTRHKSVREYDFLKYIRVVFKWALTNYDLTRAELEMLLFVYPEAVFTKSKFNSYHRIVGLYNIRTLTKFKRDGWITIWRHRQAGSPALYTLTDKAKKLCDTMHKYLTGDRKMSTNPTYNKIAEEGGPRINNYYMDIIKKMNKDRS